MKKVQKHEPAYWYPGGYPEEAEPESGNNLPQPQGWHPEQEPIFIKQTPGTTTTTPVTIYGDCKPSNGSRREYLD